MYERLAAPAGVARRTEGEKPSFSSTPAGRSSFSRQEKKKRGLQNSFVSFEKEMGGAFVPAHGVGEKSPARSAEIVPAALKAAKTPASAAGKTILHPLTQ